MSAFAAILVSILAIAAAVLAVIFLLVPLFRGLGWAIGKTFSGIGWLFSHVFGFIFGMIGDVIRAVGAVLTAVLFTPLVVLNVIIGRWSAASHFGSALKDEVTTLGHCVYRVLVGRPARFLLLSGLTEGIERRIPEAVAHAPGSDRPSSRTGQFEGYTIVGSLQGGGSGGRLYVAEPDDRKKAIFARSGRNLEQVVLKSFSLQEGSSLPQIIRESRALEAAKKLGLVLDHELTDERFFYVMEYVPGDSLTVVTKRLHSESGPDGLGARQLNHAISHIGDLLRELAVYHRGGLWHKDVKPDNIIISGGCARLVDLGLVTPLRSAMTLTTHGTEYFRDPELVRMALRGAKVRDVDGVKFDLYGVGAVLYSIVENSFPGHGGLSQVSKRCPESLRWVIRRAMTELHNRYASADEMLADVKVILDAPDPFALKPADLPSVKGGGAEQEALQAVAAEVAAVEAELSGGGTGAFHLAAARSPTPNVRNFDVAPAPDAAPNAPAAAPRPRARPAILVTDWLTGRYIARGVDPAMPTAPMPARGAKAPAAGMPGAARARRQATSVHSSAADQLARAHDRVRRAQERASHRRANFARYSNRPNAGVAFASVLTIAVVAGVIFLVMSNSGSGRERLEISHDGSMSRVLITTDRGSVTVPAPLRAEDGSIQIPQSQLDALAELGKNLTFPAAAASTGALQASVHPAMASKPARDVESAVELASGPLAPRGHVVILDVLPSDVADKERGVLDSLVSSLRRGGFFVHGRGSSAEDTSVLAAGKRVVELSSPDDLDAVERVREWLNKDPRGLDAALWIGQGAERGAVVRRLVVRDGFDAELVLLSMPAR